MSGVRDPFAWLAPPARGRALGALALLLVLLSVALSVLGAPLGNAAAPSVPARLSSTEATSTRPRSAAASAPSPAIPLDRSAPSTRKAA